MNAALTLENAFQQARQSECVKKQQEVIRNLQSQGQGNVDNVEKEYHFERSPKKRSQWKPMKSPSTKDSRPGSTQQRSTCGRCGFLKRMVQSESVGILSN